MPAGRRPDSGHHEFRRQYFHDPAAPAPAGLLPAAYAAVRNGQGQMLLVRRADDGNWELPATWYDADETRRLTVHPTMRLRLEHALPTRSACTTTSGYSSSSASKSMRRPSCQEPSTSRS